MTATSPRRSAAVASGVLALVLVALTTGVVANWQPLVATDLAVVGRVHEVVAGRPGLVAAARVVTHAGAPVTWWVVLPLAALVLLALRERATALLVAVAAAGGGLLHVTVKELVGRADRTWRTRCCRPPAMPSPAGTRAARRSASASCWSCCCPACPGRGGPSCWRRACCSPSR